MATLAKIAAADIWIVLDTVQFARRDFQHRARLVDLDHRQQRRWLSIETHLPAGRDTLICDARTADPRRASRRITEMIAAAYRTSPHRPALESIRRRTLDALATSDALADITTASTTAMLNALGWKGSIVRARDLTARAERTDRLTDLCAEVGAASYLCGTGGLRYVDPARFTRAGIDLVPYPSPGTSEGPVWWEAREITGLWAFAAHGPRTVAEAVTGLASARGLHPPMTH